FGGVRVLSGSGLRSCAVTCCPSALSRRPAGSAAPKVPPTTVTVTLPSGQTSTGDLDHISAFVVALREPDGTYRSFARHDSIPKVDRKSGVQAYRSAEGRTHPH